MSQLQDLAQPFPPSYVQQKPGGRGGDYVEHAVITQRLLEVLGPFTFVIERVIHDDPVTVLGRLSVEVDGKAVEVVEVGKSENQQDPHKSAASDALQRCAMRLGCGLHLWAQGHYYLDKSLAKREDAA